MFWLRNKKIIFLLHTLNSRPLVLNYISNYICNVKNSRLRQGLPISINDSDFAISRGFYFHETSHLQSFMKIKSSRKFPNLQYKYGEVS